MRTAATLLGLSLLGVCGPALADDFRQVARDDTLVTILDVDATEVVGDIRTAVFYTATTKANVFSRTRLEFDCANRMVRPETMVGIDPLTGRTGKEQVLGGDWRKADRAVSDSRVMKLVCFAPEERDKYAARLPQTDWRSALKAVFAPMRGPFALAFDLPVGAKGLVCTGGTVVRPAGGAPIPTDGAFRAEVDLEAKTLLFRDALGPGIASDFTIADVARSGISLGPRSGGTEPVDGRLDFGDHTLRLKGQRAEGDGGGSYAVDLQCTAEHPLP